MNKNNILVIARTLPRYDRGSGHLRLLHLLEILVKDYDIAYFSENYLKTESCNDDFYISTLDQLGITVYKDCSDLQTLLQRHFDAILFEFYDTAIRHLDEVQYKLPNSKIVIDTVDVHFAREMQMATVHNDECLLKQAHSTKYKELAVYKKADLVWAVTDEDKSHLLNEIPELQIDVIPNIHKSKEVKRNEIEKNSLQFIGNFWHQPNEDAVVYFCDQVLPHIIKEIPEVIFYIIGNAPTEKVKSLANANVKIIGWVPDTTPFLERCHVSVVPLRYGAGMKGKVGEAMSSGIPVVSSPIGVQGMDVVVGRDLLVAESAEDFSKCTIKLLRDDSLCKSISEKAKLYMEQRYGYEQMCSKVKTSFLKIINKQSSSGKNKIMASVDSESNEVDIIMPTYNTKLHLLERAVKSVIDQRLPSWRLIIVKDGGNVDITNVIDRIKDPRIEIFEITHSGKPTALNFALSKCKAKYIAYLDDDDIWYPNHLQVAVNHMREHCVDFLHTDAYEVTVLRDDHQSTELSRKILNLGVLTNKTLVSISHINAVHTLDIITKAGFYDISREFFIDWDMFIRIAEHCHPQHLAIPTCEHYIYVNNENLQINTITGRHKNDPELSRMMQIDMYKRSFYLLTPDDFAEFVFDWGSKNWQINNLKEITLKAQDDSSAKDAKINELYNSLSWRITSPLRWLYSLFK